MEQLQPILVCYLQRHTFEEPTIIKSFQTAINGYLESKKSDCLVFVVPTDKEERIECINPVYLEDSQTEEYGKLKALLSDLEKRFDIGQPTQSSGVEEGRA